MMDSRGGALPGFSRGMTYRPDLYDAVTPGPFQGDVDWYRRQAEASGGPVLELGAGTGRVTLPIADAGISIHALDLNRAMLDALTAKLATRPEAVRQRVTIVTADMRTFELAERFALVIAPFRAFLHNITEADRLACLRRVRDHLRRGGRFAFNVFHPSLEMMSRHTGPLAGVWRVRETHALPGGGFVVRSEANRYDTVNQIVHSLHRYEEYSADGVQVRTSLHRLDLAYLYPPDIRRLLTEAGFANITIAGSFDGREFAHDTDELVIEAW
ncbi:MAG TPA: class I SAM-dependent methyltransferase [Vicinamibacterales bacterium]|nr:class I SAM-dependent methyltransferase [Vicinamibacterales bacterium]